MDKYNVYINQLLIYLALPENKGKEFKYNDLPRLANIPKEYQSETMKIMHHRGYLEGKAGLNPDVHVSSKGLIEANKVQDLYFNQNNNPLIKINQIEATLDEACEEVFKMHKSDDNYTHWWSKESYIDKPKNLNAAKLFLINKKIIFEKNVNGQNGTLLNPDLFLIGSFKEALKIMEEKELDKEKTDIHFGDRYNTMGAQSPIAIGKHIRQTINEKEVSKKEKWYIKFFNHFMEHLAKYATGIALGYIAGIFTGQSCNKTTNLKHNLKDTLQNTVITSKK